MNMSKRGLPELDPSSFWAGTSTSPVDGETIGVEIHPAVVDPSSEPKWWVRSFHFGTRTKNEQMQPLSLRFVHLWWEQFLGVPYNVVFEWGVRTVKPAKTISEAFPLAGVDTTPP